MTPELWIVLLQFATKFGIDAAITVGEALNKPATVDDAIAALRVAKAKTAADYLAEAQKSQ